MSTFPVYDPLGIGDQLFRGYQGNWVKAQDLRQELAHLLVLVNGEENPKETLRNRLTILQLNLNRTGPR